jgi:hypothetical protein
LTLREKALGFDHADVALSLFTLATLYQKLERYFLSVDTAKFDQSGKGVEGKVEGECHMRMNKDG